MMAYITEDYIKRVLDGSFFYIDLDGKVRHRFVEVSFIPTHKQGSFASLNNIDEELQVDKPSNGHHIVWPEGAFATMESMRERGFTWMKISERMGASPSAAQEYYKKHREINQALEDAKYREARTREVKKMIKRGMDLRKIKVETGYSASFIKSVHSMIEEET